MRVTFSIRIATYFAPDNDLEEKVSAEIERAQYSICIQAYKFASPQIKNALLQWLQGKRDRQGSLVLKILLDRRETHKSLKAWKKFQNAKGKPIPPNALQASVIQELRSKGADIRCIPARDIDKSHNKVMIIDEKTVLTGSFNYKSHNYELQRKKKQIDNLVILEHTAVAKNYQKMFDNYFDSSPKGTL